MSNKLTRYIHRDNISTMYATTAVIMIFSALTGVIAVLIDGIISSRFIGSDVYSGIALIRPFSSVVLMLASFVSTGCKRPYTMRTLFYGTKGTIICDNKSDTMQLYTLGEDGIAVDPVPEIIPVEVNNHNTDREFEVFADSILNDSPVEMDARLGAKTIAACLAIVESSETGRPVVPDYDF